VRLDLPAKLAPRAFDDVAALGDGQGPRRRPELAPEPLHVDEHLALERARQLRRQGDHVLANLPVDALEAQLLRPVEDPLHEGGDALEDAPQHRPRLGVERPDLGVGARANQAVSSSGSFK